MLHLLRRRAVRADMPPRDRGQGEEADKDDSTTGPLAAIHWPGSLCGGVLTRPHPCPRTRDVAVGAPGSVLIARADLASGSPKTARAALSRTLVLARYGTWSPCSCGAPSETIGRSLNPDKRSGPLYRLQ
uniref:Uncharacterized protein n=1 Tax=Aegilops tauschii subsp. strangulata TaxID=200361 RepID=A0A453NCA2_AEGTS